MTNREHKSKKHRNYVHRDQAKKISKNSVEKQLTMIHDDSKVKRGRKGGSMDSNTIETNANKRLVITRHKMGKMAKDESGSLRSSGSFRGSNRLRIECAQENANYEKSKRNIQLKQHRIEETLITNRPLIHSSIITTAENYCLENNCPPEQTTMTTNLLNCKNYTGHNLPHSRLPKEAATAAYSQLLMPSKQFLSSSSSGIHDVIVTSADLKFSCAHFVAYKGFRERLHGHNYTTHVRLCGPVGIDGYVIDFGDIKAALKLICKNMNEYLIVPAKSDVLKITENHDNVKIECEDKSIFVLPRKDCLFLPIVHSTVEEIASYLLTKLIDQLTLPFIQQRCLQWIELTVYENPTQGARYSKSLLF